ncbi:hypothetical protein AcV5_005242 [Taiwanofungus camphoratus]|nr:hypothetical protein AcW2_000153 [Antrodia cinnamomea]KAI0937302.1 hypothetical protein AcV5_005242 [Antrodia cinnamomea]KAI0962512.1 hypothetical protein AcV7_001343 [Antrodia cinnamomea]
MVFGAGTAGLGIVRQLRDGIVTLDDLSENEANKHFYLVDRFGLVKESFVPDRVRDALHDFVRPDSEWEGVPANDKGCWKP